ncbi:MAG: pre-peptidase C-terminal domain-containing protein [bacterium]|nr:pre-peptidase C-terminal domain-containing protein [bacterium]
MSLKRPLSLLIALAFGLAFAVSPQHAAARQEPAGTLTYDRPVSGRIDDAAPRAAYLFDGLRGEVVTLTLRVTDGDLDPILTVIDGDGNPLAVRDDGGAGRDLRVEFVRIPRSAAYNVIVGRFGIDVGTTSGAFELEISREGVSFSSGSALRYGDSVYNTISDMTPQVYYTFRAARGDVIAVRMQRVSGDLDAFLQIVDSSGFVIAENDDVMGAGSLDAQVTALGIQADGVYAIVASRFGQAAGRSRGSFVLTLETAAQSGLGASSDFSIPLTPGTPIEGDIRADRPAVYFSFQGRRDEIVTLTMRRASGNLDTFIALADSTLREIASDDDSGGGQNSLIRDFVLPADGVYTVIATRYERAQGTTTGRFTLTVESAGSAFDLLRDDALRLSYGSTVTGRIDDSAPDILYGFYGRAGDAITISMSRADGDLDPLLTLLDAALTPLLSDDDSGNGQDARIERITLPTTGIYYIRAGRFTGEGALPTRGSFILVLARLQS